MQELANFVVLLGFLILVWLGYAVIFKFFELVGKLVDRCKWFDILGKFGG